MELNEIREKYPKIFNFIRPIETTKNPEKIIGFYTYKIEQNNDKEKLYQWIEYLSEKNPEYAVLAYSNLKRKFNEDKKEIEKIIIDTICKKEEGAELLKKLMIVFLELDEFERAVLLYKLINKIYRYENINGKDKKLSVIIKEFNKIVTINGICNNNIKRKVRPILNRIIELINRLEIQTNKELNDEKEKLILQVQNSSFYLDKKKITDFLNKLPKDNKTKAISYIIIQNCNKIKSIQFCIENLTTIQNLMHDEIVKNMYSQLLEPVIQLKQIADNILIEKENTENYADIKDAYFELFNKLFGYKGITVMCLDNNINFINDIINDYLIYSEEELNFIKELKDKLEKIKAIKLDNKTYTLEEELNIQSYTENTINDMYKLIEIYAKENGMIKTVILNEQITEKEYNIINYCCKKYNIVNNLEIYFEEESIVKLNYDLILQLIKIRNKIKNEKNLKINKTVQEFINENMGLRRYIELRKYIDKLLANSDKKNKNEFELIVKKITNYNDREFLKRFLNEYELREYLNKLIDSQEVDDKDEFKLIIKKIIVYKMTMKKSFKDNRIRKFIKEELINSEKEKNDESKMKEEKITNYCQKKSTTSNTYKCIDNITLFEEIVKQFLEESRYDLILKNIYIYICKKHRKETEKLYNEKIFYDFKYLPKDDNREIISKIVKELIDKGYIYSVIIFLDSINVKKYMEFLPNDKTIEEYFNELAKECSVRGLRIQKKIFYEINIEKYDNDFVTCSKKFMQYLDTTYEEKTSKLIIQLEELLKILTYNIKLLDNDEYIKNKVNELSEYCNKNIIKGTHGGTRKYTVTTITKILEEEDKLENKIKYLKKMKELNVFKYNETEKKIDFYKVNFSYGVLEAESKRILKKLLENTNDNNINDIVFIYMNTYLKYTISIENFICELEKYSYKGIYKALNNYNFYLKCLHKSKKNNAYNAKIKNVKMDNLITLNPNVYRFNQEYYNVKISGYNHFWNEVNIELKDSSITKKR